MKKAKTGMNDNIVVINTHVQIAETSLSNILGNIN